MDSLDKSQVSAVLNEIGLLLELVGENPFKSRAYYQAARAIEGLEEDLETLVREGRLGEVPGLGPALKEKITTLVTTGQLPYYENLRAQVPPGLLEMLRIPGLGPRKVQTLYRALGLTTLEELEEACRQHRVQGLPGFGLKTELKILAGLEWLAQSKGLHLWVEAWISPRNCRRFGRPFRSKRDRHRGQFAPAQGSGQGYRPGRGDDRARSRWPRHSPVSPRGQGQRQRRDQGGGNLTDRHRRRPASRGARDLRHSLHHLTGSKEHNAALRGLAKDRGLKLNEYGLFRGEERLLLESEEEIYQALGLAYIPPELREDLGEDRGRRSARPARAGQGEEVRGALHNHTSASDGTASLAEMAAAAAALGWDYLGIGDHSQSAFYAGGLRPEAVLKQWEAIAAHNQAGRRPYLLAGIESEIKPDGSLDYPDEILARFDYVVASIHAG